MGPDFDLWEFVDLDGENDAVILPDRPMRVLKADPPGEWLTATEAAQHLRLPTVNALYQRVARGQMKVLRLGRQMRFRRRDLDALMLPA